MLLTPPASPKQRLRDLVPETPLRPVRARSPQAPRKAQLPPLMWALQCWHLEGVRQSLEEDPEAAQFPFWEHGLEQPLCAAVRLGCGPQIIKLLLEHGAAVNAVDAKGRTPLSILKSDNCRWGALPLNDDGACIENMLLQAGAQESTVSDDADTTASEGEDTIFVCNGDMSALPPMPEFFSLSSTACKLSELF